jgi:hypothetical protein
MTTQVVERHHQQGGTFHITPGMSVLDSYFFEADVYLYRGSAINGCHFVNCRVYERTWWGTWRLVSG